MKGIFWSLAFVLSLVLLAAAYYVTSSSMRSMVNARAPWVEPYLRPYIRNHVESDDSTDVKSQEPERVASAPAAPTPAAPEVFDLTKLATNKAAWPAKVTIKKATKFPAVSGGKVVGGLTAPVGTEVVLVTISGGKLGVEYQGGGAWLPLEDTDLVARWERSH